MDAEQGLPLSEQPGPALVPSTSRRRFADVSRAARWGAPGVSQIVSSLGNVALIVIAARVMSVQRFGDFSLAYAGVLLVSQLVRVALGEASMLWAASSDDIPDAAPMVLGAALAVTPTIGVVAGGLTLFISGSVSFALATGFGVCLVSLADTTRYALLARGRVRRSVLFDIIWTFSEFGGLLVLWWRGTFSPALLLLVWVLSAILAVTSAVGAVRPGGPFQSLRAVARNPHWWRLAVNEAIITGSSYALLAILGITGGTGYVGAVRAALLPYLWVQLAISAIWLVVLSRRPTAVQLRCFSLLMAEILLAAILVTAATVKLIPDSVGLRVLGERWEQVSRLGVYAALAYAALAVAELLVLQLKAVADTGAVLNARLFGALVTACVSIAIIVSPSPTIALIGVIAGHVAVAAVALQRRRKSRLRTGAAVV